MTPYGSSDKQAGKMKETKEELRFATIERLQRKMAKLNPGSQRFELYDKACELALSAKRTVNEYLIRNVLRDARNILNRKFKPHFVALDTPAAAGVESMLFDRAICFNEGAANLERRQLLNSVLFICEHVHKRAGEVFTCMLDGYNINDTAERSRLSQSLVKKIRTNLKKEIKLKFNN